MKKSLIYLCITFTVTRLFFYFFGVRFDGETYNFNFLQFIDPVLLKTDLFNSIYYTSFPPLYNLFIGIILKLFAGPNIVFYAIHLGLGLTLYISLFYLMRIFDIHSIISYAAATVFIMIPPTILYENWLFYTYPITALLLFSTLLFYNFLKSFDFKYGFVLFLCCSIIALTNAIWSNFVYLLIIILIGVIFFRPIKQRKILFKKLAVSCVPILLIFAVCAKNYIHYGKYAVDVHSGFHIANGLYLSSIGDPYFQEKFRDKYRLFSILPISPMDTFYNETGLLSPTGITLLDQNLKSNGYVNYHSRYYIKLSGIYSKLIYSFVTDYPFAYLRFVCRSVVNYNQPSNTFMGMNQANRAWIGFLDESYTHFYPLFLICYGIGIIAVILSFKSKELFQEYKNGRFHTICLSNEQKITLFFLLLICFYNALPILVTIGENQRYKYSSEPFLFVFAAFAFNICFYKLSFLFTKIKHIENMDKAMDARLSDIEQKIKKSHMPKNRNNIILK